MTAKGLGIEDWLDVLVNMVMNMFTCNGWCCRSGVLGVPD